MHIEKEYILNLQTESFIQNSVIDMNNVIIGLSSVYHLIMLVRLKQFIMNREF